MPKLQPRFFIFVFAAIIIAVIIIAAASSSTAPPVVKPTPTPAVATPTPVPAVLSFTVKAGAGIQTVIVTNQNSGATITLTASDLPATYNCKNGDTLTFKVTASPGYLFNAWIFNDGTFQSRNPYTIKASASFTMECKFLMLQT